MECRVTDPSHQVGSDGEPRIPLLLSAVGGMVDEAGHVAVVRGVDRLGQVEAEAVRACA